MYLIIGSQPNLAFTVSALTKLASKPTKEYMEVLKQVLHYLKGIQDLKLIYNKPMDNQLTLIGYSNTDYRGDRNDQKSTTRNIFQIAGNTICWRSVKQYCISTSIVEAEYIALSTTTKQQLWLQNALNELHIDLSATALHTDNNGTIDLTNNLRISNKSKYIDIVYYHVWDLVETGKINLLHVPSKDNLADINTKALPTPQFLYLREQVLGR